MDDAILLNRCLSADEVSALKDGTFATEPSALPAGVGLSATYNGETVRYVLEWRPSGGFIIFVR